jgi:type I site-specific restriction-modification system R (restriction) subunit
MAVAAITSFPVFKFKITVIPRSLGATKKIKKGYETPDNKRIDIDLAFKEPEHKFRVAIVCAMWMTGFDVPSLSTLYLDKPLKAHTLMQAIARANRVYEEKEMVSLSITAEF